MPVISPHAEVDTGSCPNVAPALYSTVMGPPSLTIGLSKEVGENREGVSHAARTGWPLVHSTKLAASEVVVDRFKTRKSLSPMPRFLPPV